MSSSSKSISPVGWYVGSYLLRFIEVDAKGNDDPEGRFLVWENTVIVRAESFEQAYAKVQAIGEGETAPYQGAGLTPADWEITQAAADRMGVNVDEITDSKQKGPVAVQWVFEGISDLLPIYDELADGTEIMWANHNKRKLKTVKRWAKTCDQLKQD